MNNYVDYILEQAKNLLAIDSPSGYTAEVTAYLLEEYKRRATRPGSPGRAASWLILAARARPFFWQPMWTP